MSRNFSPFYDVELVYIFDFHCKGSQHSLYLYSPCLPSLCGAFVCQRLFQICFSLGVYEALNICIIDKRGYRRNFELLKLLQSTESTDSQAPAHFTWTIWMFQPVLDFMSPSGIILQANTQVGNRCEICHLLLVLIGGTRRRECGTVDTQRSNRNLLYAFKFLFYKCEFQMCCRPGGRTRCLLTYDASISHSNDS